MNLKSVLETLKLEPYVIALFGMVVLASVLPVRGAAAHELNIVVKLAIALLFFLHGAKLSRESVVAGVTHWRLHLLILAFTFVMFPILGLAISKLGLLPPTLAAGMVFLCCLPSTVQSSIAFTSIARGNVAAAVVAASASNLFGIFITPVLVGLLMHTTGAASGGWSSVRDIVVQLLLPFVVGQLARPLVAGWITRHKVLIGYVDRGSILLVVYAAFSEAVVGGIWHRISPAQLGVLLAVCGGLLAVVLAATTFGARALGFSPEDERTITFCGSKKSLATGVPMAGILFPGPTAGILVLPLMIFHQIQLMACSVIAQRYARRTPSPASEA